MLTREDIEARECEMLAPFALKAGDSIGREKQEEPHKYRTGFQRDRDRIIHSSSFRRLEYKTQVFVNHAGDNYRTRLTHTMEVAQIARSIARAMRLNEDFVEALGLAHDLGLTPFGHSGESELNDIMADDGGFEHNRQSRRIVRNLENNFHGLNLTREVTDSIIKHRTIYDKSETTAEIGFLETQVVNLADEISYNCHDMDDGLSAGILQLSELEKLDIWQMGAEVVDRDYPSLEGSWRMDRIIVSILNIYVTDLIRTSEERIAKADITSLEDVRACKDPLIALSDELGSVNGILQKHLRENL